MAGAVLDARSAANQLLRDSQCGKQRCPCLKAADRGRGLTHCPVHQDEKPSFNVTVKDNRLLVHCETGCAQADVVAALKENGVWPEHASVGKEIIATYDYRAADGTLLYQAVRYFPKDFLQRRPTGPDKWEWKLGDVERVLYRLPDLLSSGNRVVFIVEGEKDVDRLYGLGFVATCNVGGAGKWRDEYSAHLAGRQVIVVPDNDRAGRDHSRQVAASLHGHAQSVRWLELPGLEEKGDVSDWLDDGGTAEQLRELARQAGPVPVLEVAPISASSADQLGYGVEGDALVQRHRVGDKTMLFRAEAVRQERTGVHARVTVACDDATLAWSTFNVEKDEDRVRLTNSAYGHLEYRNGTGKVQGLPEYPKSLLKADLDGFCAGLWDARLQQTMPTLMAGSNERAQPAFLVRPYILDGGGTILFAPPGRGKSYLLLLMAVSLDAGLSALWPVSQKRALFINLERSQRSVEDRLGNVNAVLGLNRDRRLATINARGRTLMDVAAAAQRYIDEHEVGCVFVDSISRAGAGDLTANDSTNRIIDQLNRFGCAWFGLAHTPRQDESHLYGSIHFEAGADLVVQLLSEQEENGPLGIGLQLTKKNDVGNMPLQVLALEFDEAGLVKVRYANKNEFPDIESKRKKTLRETVREHLEDMGAQSATEIANAIKANRSNVADLLRKDSATFMQAGRLGRNVLYEVRSDA